MKLSSKLTLKLTMEHLQALTFTFCILSFIVNNSRANIACDKSLCRGPIRYYDELNCKPVYKTPESCCPYKYDCDHLKKRLPHKCYVGNNSYHIGEELDKNDANPCNIDCKCSDSSKRAEFICIIVDCPIENIEEGCYLKQNATECCPKVFCPENNMKRPTCSVDGQIYKDGERFIPKLEPDKICYCSPEYQNQNVEPFCKVNNHPCNSEIQKQYDENCAPAYYSHESPQTDCNYIYRCKNNRDKVIKKFKEGHYPDGTDDVVCKFGDLIMKYGDELVQTSSYDSICMNCTCEVGPFPTCQRLPFTICT